MSKKRQLLATMTGEPFQPVRLYYSIPGISFVTKELAGLECMFEVKDDGCWEWSFEGEARPLRFGRGGYDDVPKDRRPIVLGRVRFPSSLSMTLQTNSIDRAISAARFFAPLLGPKVVSIRMRLVNRFFAADEGAPNELTAMLDRDVTVIDPREIEAALENARTRREAEKILEKRRLEDVPPVEDFPLYPEEETPNFQHLAATLHFRFVRPFEHWQGNTHLNLVEIIRRTVEQQMRGTSRPKS